MNLVVHKMKDYLTNRIFFQIEQLFEQRIFDNNFSLCMFCQQNSEDQVIVVLPLIRQVNRSEINKLKKRKLISDWGFGLKTIPNRKAKCKYFK